MSDVILKNIIKYYQRITDMSLVSLKNFKKFQFRKHLTNHSLLVVVNDNFEKIHRSKKSMKLIKEYNIAMNKMYKTAQKEYNKVLNLIKSTNDINLQQKILNDYAMTGVHGFTAKNGAKWNIETYSNMYTRHVNNQLIRMNVIENARSGSKFEVSSHGTKCKLCEVYEGKIMTEEELNNSTLFHNNCMHFVSEVKV